MSIEPEMRQRLLELVYDLLSEDEAAQLRQQIESDPELARAYEEAQATSRLMGEAARVQSPRLELKRPEPEKAEGARTAPAPDVSRSKAAVRAEGAAAGSRGGWAQWTVSIAAGILLMLSLGGYLYHRNQLAAIAGEHLRLVVNGPSTLQAGLDNRFTVTTSTVTGVPVAKAQVELALYTPQQKRLVSWKDETDEEGRLEVIVPADLELPDRAELKVVATSGGKRQEVDARLGIETVRHAAHLSLDRPLYQPGDTVFYRSLTLTRFGLAVDRPLTVQFEILDPGGAAVPDSRAEGETTRGVGSGAFAIPEGLRGGEYTLVARSPEGLFPEEKRTFFIRRYRAPRLKKELEFARDSYAPGETVVADFSAERAEGGPAAGARLTIVAEVDGEVAHRQNAAASQSGTYRVEFKLPEKIGQGDGLLRVAVDDGGTLETIVKRVPINLGTLEVKFYPEGGDLVAGLENRVYFAARDPAGEPVHVRGEVVNSAGNSLGTIETYHEGMGTFTFRPSPDERYRLRITSPAGVTNEPELPKPSRGQKIALTTGLGVFEAEKPLEFNVQAAKAGMPLVAAATCRGVPVGQQWFTTITGKEGEPGANPVTIPLPPEVGGVVRLTIYDYSTSPPVPLAERLVYRRPARRLKVHVAGHSERYAPGQTANLALVVTDEENRPVPATLGVAVADDSVLNLADDDTASMRTHFLLTTEVEKPEDLEDADFYLSDDPKAPVALDMLLGTQGWRRFVERTLEELKKEKGDAEDEQLDRLVALGGVAKPPAMFDNLGQIDATYREAVAKIQADRTHEWNTLVVVSLLGAMGLVLFVALSALMNVARGMRVWLPALGAAAACLVMGGILMNPESLKPGKHGAVAFARFEVPPPDMTETAPEDAQWGMLEGAMPVADAAVQAPMPPGALLPPMAGAAAAMPEKAEQKDKAAEVAGLALARRLVPADRLDGLRMEFRRGAEAAKKFDGKARQRGRGERALDEDLAKRRFVVREYAHQYTRPEGTPPGVRTDFAETLYWHPMLVADEDGRAEIRFDLPDSTTTFRVMADAHGDGGRIGSGSGELVCRIPFNLQPKLPLEVTAGDRIDLPVAVVNDTNRELPVELILEHDKLLQLEGSAKQQLRLAPEKRHRAHFALEVVGQKGQSKLTLRGLAGPLGDEVRKELRVVPPGFPKSLSYSGKLEGEQEVVVDLPEQWVPGSLEVALNVFPSTLADLQKGMDGILREPTGCFEQASTANYPNVLAAQYMDEHDVANPEITRRARDLMKKGYTKLAGYESPKKKGYEWFGGDPGHEALTAYGLMEFRDMAKVYEVDPEMLKRTGEWLLERRDGKGGFQRNPKALDSFGAAPQDITDAYITWALTESGQQGIETEVKHAVALGEKSDDPYLVALAASSAISAGQKDQGKKLLDKLAKSQAEDGHLDAKTTSITRSGGRSLSVETTALAALAWLKLPEYSAQANKAVEWITKSRQGSGGFGSTQATILALKALVEHTKANRRTVNDGKLIVKRDDAVVGQRDFSAGQQETILLEGLEAKLASGENKLTITLTGNNKLPYALDVSYRSSKPASDRDCPVRLSTSLARQKVAAGETVALKAELVNTTDKGQPMTVAILGLPAGLEARPDQLKELKKAGTIDYFETGAREVICYWRSLAPGRKVDLKLDLVAEIPGRYTGPASRAYLYYTAEQKQWADPLAVEITH